MSKYYLLMTKHRSEARACDELKKQGYTTYAPQMPVDQRLGTKKKTELVWPRYIFLLDSGDFDMSKPRNTKGVLKYVRFGDVFATIDAQMINNYIEEEITRFYNLPPESYTQGERVYIKEGPFTGLEGIFVKQSGERVRILLEMLSTKRVVNLKFNSIEPISISQ